MLAIKPGSTGTHPESRLQTAAERIRRARTVAGISQVALAEAVGVQRSAVAQWERRDGCYPSMPHLVAIAVATGVALEWLGTGRGSIRPEGEDWGQGVEARDFAQDELEAGCLVMLRRLPFHLRKQIVGMLELMARNF